MFDLFLHAVKEMFNKELLSKNLSSKILTIFNFYNSELKKRLCFILRKE